MIHKFKLDMNRENVKGSKFQKHNLLSKITSGMKYWQIQFLIKTLCDTTGQFFLNLIRKN